MIIHVDTTTGSPLFVMDQMMMIGAIRDVYNKYGIHGIYYAVLFGWPGSPFYSVISEPARDELVVQEVYGTKYYDPVQKEEILTERFSCKEQFNQSDMKLAIQSINSLAPVPVLEEKYLYTRLLEINKSGLERQADPQDYKGQTEIAKAQKELFSSRKTLNAFLDEVHKKEKDILLKSDPQMSLSDFINKIIPPRDGKYEVSKSQS